MKEEQQKELQQKYMHLQLMQQQIKQLQQQIQQFEQQIAELDSLSQSLDDLKKVKPGSDTLVPISSGIFAKATLKDNEELLVNVGANTVVKKSVSDTKKLIEKQSSEVRKLQEQLLEQLQKAAVAAESTEKELQKLVEGSKE
ncbi:MAG: prefoldin subunit alpha [Candidatus Omnitrophota bacterium]|nr:MAG: prefoldin subunit alpha [Candidatus Omnitrophota bacterium]